jgi:hypothetical protein
MKTKGFSILEALVVVGILILIIAACSPKYFSQIPSSTPVIKPIPSDDDSDWWGFPVD